MPEIKAFRGWRYNAAKIKDLSRVYAPPYDIISKSEQEALYRRSSFNVIRLELGKQTKKDSARDNRYTRAAHHLAVWKKKEILLKETKPALYVYTQQYSEGGKKKTRIGFLAAMKLDERFVLRHENTLARPKKDRLALLEKTKTNLSPIFGLFEDPSGRIHRLLCTTLKKQPEIDVLIGEVRHRLYTETRPEVYDAICEAMQKKPMFIADGHHRFEVTCQYRRLRKSKDPVGGGKEWEYAMVYFADAFGNPFRIFPTHRMIRQAGLTRAAELLKSIGTVRKVRGLPAILSRLARSRWESGDTEYVFGFYTKQEGFFLVTLDRSITRALGKNPVGHLDVAVLHDKILGPLFNIKSVATSERIDFTRDPDEAREKVKKGVFDLAFFLRPTSLKEVLWISRQGLKMPQKSTYFYPKLLSGLVFHGLEPEEGAGS